MSRKSGNRFSDRDMRHSKTTPARMRQKHHARGQSNEIDSHLPPDRLSHSPPASKRTPMARRVLLVRAYFFLIITAGFFGMSPTAAQAQAGFDGLWTILIVTEAGEC